MRVSGLTRLFAILLFAAIMIGALSVSFPLFADDAAEETTDQLDSSDVSATDQEPKDEVVLGQDQSEEVKLMLYSDYIRKYSDVPAGTEEIVINCCEDYLPEESTAEVEEKHNYEGASSALYMPEVGKTSFKFTVNKTGLYSIRFKYFPIEGTKTTMERSLYIDGHMPFSETRYLYLPRPWTYELTEDNDFDKDINGNDIRPVRVMTTKVYTDADNWEDYYLRDWLGFTQDAFKFYLTEGEHVMTLQANREPMIIEKITLYPSKEPDTYENVLAKWRSEGYTEVGPEVETIKVQAEKPYSVSVQTIFPANDRTSSLTEPQDPTKIKYNILDYASCTQFVRYKVDIKKTGLYEIDVRFRQNSLIGMFTSRKITINGELQFKEAGRCRFVYDTAFQSKPLNNGKDEFLFLLHEGENIIEFEVVLGDLADAVYEIRQLIDKLNEAYTSILMITGPSPDASRDYGFSRIVPGAITTIAQAARKLYELSDQIVETTGEKGDQSQALETYAMLFRKMAGDEYQIAGNLTTFKNYIVNLSNWIYAALAQPMKMDYFTIQSPSAERPRALPNFFESLMFEVSAFAGSFVMDYTTIGFRATGEAKEYDDTITMWSAGDREGMLILRRIIDSYFTPEYNIGLTIKVISAGLTEAIIAGIGPDIASMGATDTITWGLRTAVEPLNGFEGFEETIKNYEPAAMVPLTLYGTTYGMPEAMAFKMMFYRADVLEELDLSIPKTWNDLYEMLSVLQNKHLQVGMPSGLDGTLLFLLQRDIDLYKDDGMRINLDSNEALSAFESLTDFYTKYSSPAVWEITRFRSGEIPIMVGEGIAMYNTLMSYYELRGLWKMAPLLSTVREDGTLNNISVSGVAGNIIPRGANNPESSWKYIMWKASSATWKRMVDESIAVTSPTYKVATANVEALLGQPWTVEEKEAISTQIKNLKAIPEYPGGYIVSVYANNAFYDVYNNHAEPSTAMLDRVLDINKEISRKRREFKMETYEDVVAKENAANNSQG